MWIRGTPRSLLDAMVEPWVWEALQLALLGLWAQPRLRLSMLSFWGDGLLPCPLLCPSDAPQIPPQQKCFGV